MDGMECKLTIAPFLLYRFSVNVMHDHHWDHLGISGIIGCQYGVYLIDDVWLIGHSPSSCQ